MGEAGEEGLGGPRSGRAPQARRGTVWQGKAWRGWARKGGARQERNSGHVLGSAPQNAAPAQGYPRLALTLTR